jgi:zinc transport system substrate-binding protein
MTPLGITRSAGQHRVALVGAALGFLAASAATQEVPRDKLHVVVSILPQAYFVERVGGERVDVEVLVGPGQSPHAYDLSPKQLEGLSHAKVYFRIGVDFEVALVPRIQRLFKDLNIVDLRTGVPLRTLTAAEVSVEAEHDGHGESHTEEPHVHAGRPDPHIWLNPLLVKTQARTICDALVKLDPQHAADYHKNLAAFEGDLDRVHAEIAKTLAPLKGHELFVFHPAFGYFADAYGLKQVPVEIEGKEPTAKQLAELIARAKVDQVKVIFVQPQFSRKSAEAVAQAIGGAVVPIDDLARDYLKNLEDIAAKIKAGLEQSPQ